MEKNVLILLYCCFCSLQCYINSCLFIYYHSALYYFIVNSGACLSLYSLCRIPSIIVGATGLVFMNQNCNILNFQHLFLSQWTRPVTLELIYFKIGFLEQKKILFHEENDTMNIFCDTSLPLFSFWYAEVLLEICKDIYIKNKIFLENSNSFVES